MSVFRNLPVTTCESRGMSPGGGAAGNSVALQSALSAGGLVTLTRPGVYELGGSGVDSEALVSLRSDLSWYLGPGVIVRNALPSGSSKSFAYTSNYKSNAFAISGQVGATQAPTNVWLQELTCTGHPFIAGDYVLIKGDTSRKNLGVFKVAAVSGNTFSIYRYGGAPSAPTGAPVAYKANANIRIFGEGKIDLNKHTTNTNLRAHGIVICKAANVRIEVPIVGCPKYSAIISNCHDSYFRAGTMEHPSDVVHLRGFCYNIEIEDLFGEASDDPVALVTSDPAYQHTDADATVNSQGEIAGVTIRNHCVRSQQTRGILIAPSSAGDIFDVQIDLLRNLTATQQELIRLGIPSGNTGRINGLTIGSVQANPAQGESVIVMEDQAATLNVDGFHIQSLVVGDLVASSGITASPIYFGTAAGTINMSIGQISAEADMASGAVSYGLIEANDGAVYANVGQVSVVGSGNTRQCAVVRSSGTGGVVANIGAVCQRVGGQALANFSGTGTNELSVDSWYFDQGATGGGMMVSSNQNCTVRASNVRVVGSGFSGLFNFFGSSKTHDVQLGNVHVNGNGFVSLGTSNALNIAVQSGRFTGGGSLFNTYGTTPDIRLTSDVTGSSCTINGSNLNATSTNHALGAKFYNSAAGFGAGVGAYVNGAAAWTRVAA